jgi:hypothetical protein
MKEFYKKIKHPDESKHSKALQILKYIGQDGSEKDVNFELFAAQNFNINSSFNKLFSFLSLQNKPVKIIEIGTFKGGLTVILDTFAKAHNLDYSLCTYDITDRLISKDVKEIFEELKVELTIKDVFSDDGKEIIDLISNPDYITVLFCDGGKKAEEVSKFSKSLKTGDIILGHDYGFDAQEFQKKEWNAYELSFSQVASAYNSSNLRFLFKDLMEDSVWFCARKTNPVGKTLQILTVCNEPYVDIMMNLIVSLETYHPEVPVKMLSLNLSDESKKRFRCHSNISFIDDTYSDFKNFEEERAYCESCRTWNTKNILSETCSDVFYVDGDVYLEDNVYDLFDFFESTDFCARIKIDNPLRFNAGMIYVKNTPDNFKIIEEWERETRKHGWVWLSAQNELGNVLERHKEKVVVKTFPKKFDGIDTNPETVLVHMKGPQKKKR